MWRLAALAALCVGCTSTDYSATIVVKRLEGAYRFDYGPIAFERPDTTVFNDPETTPECCLGVYRRTATTLGFAIGNVVEPPNPFECQPVAQLRLYLDDVPAAAPHLIDLGAATTRAFVWYAESDPGECLTVVNTSTSRPFELSVHGHVRLDTMHCSTEPDGLGCALQAEGEWALESKDGALRSTGWFRSDDY